MNGEFGGRAPTRVGAKLCPLRRDEKNQKTETKLLCNVTVLSALKHSERTKLLLGASTKGLQRAINKSW